MSRATSILLVAWPVLLLGACTSGGACEFWSTGGDGITEQYYCWNGEEQDFCESAGGIESAYHQGKRCDDLGYGYECTQAEMGEGALQEQWTSAPSCDTSNPPVGRTPGEGGGDGGSSCTDGYGICSQLNSGDVTAFQQECEGAGNVFSSSACPTGAYSCTGGTGTSSGTTTSIDIQWPAGVCDQPAFQDIIYLEGTCVNVLGGTYSGDADSCCTGTTSPVPGGTTCQ
jgi:hypothetical protein